jgi:hypothetical protein
MMYIQNRMLMPSTPWQLLLPVNAMAVVDATNIMAVAGDIS